MFNMSNKVFEISKRKDIMKLIFHISLLSRISFTYKPTASFFSHRIVESPRIVFKMRSILCKKFWNLFYSNVLGYPLKLDCFNIKWKSNTREVKLQQNEELKSIGQRQFMYLRYINAFIHHKMELDIAEINHRYTENAKITIYR